MESSLDVKNRLHSNWTLEDDAELLVKLNDVSEKIFASVDGIQQELSSLHHSCERSEITLDSMVNDLSVLSNMQFLEHRVYDDDVLKKDGCISAKPRTKQEEEASFLVALKFGLKEGLSLIDECFTKVVIRPEDLDEIDDPTFQPEPVYEPKDSYANRRLPVLIGTDTFKRCRYLGLREDIKPSEIQDSKTVAQSSPESVSLSIPPNPPAQPTCSSSASSTTASDNSGLFASIAKDVKNETLLAKPSVSTSQEFQAHLNAKLASLNAATDVPCSKISSMDDNEERLSPSIRVYPIDGEKLTKASEIRPNHAETQETTKPYRAYDSLFGQSPPPIVDEDTESDDDLFGPAATKNFLKPSTKESRTDSTAHKKIAENKVISRSLASNIGYKTARLFEESEDDDLDLFSGFRSKDNNRLYTESVKQVETVIPKKCPEKPLANKEENLLNLYIYVTSLLIFLIIAPVAAKQPAKSRNLLSGDNGGEDSFSRSSKGVITVQSNENMPVSNNEKAAIIKRSVPISSSRLFDSSDDETDIFSSKVQTSVVPVSEKVEESSTLQENPCINNFSNENIVDQQFTDNKRVSQESVVIKPKISSTSDSSTALANVLSSGLINSGRSEQAYRDIGVCSNMKDELVPGQPHDFTTSKDKAGRQTDEGFKREVEKILSNPSISSEKEINENHIKNDRTYDSKSIITADHSEVSHEASTDAVTAVNTQHVGMSSVEKIGHTTSDARNTLADILKGGIANHAVQKGRSELLTDENDQEPGNNCSNEKKISTETPGLADHIIFCAQKTRPKMPAGRRRPPTFSKKKVESGDTAAYNNVVFDYPENPSTSSGSAVNNLKTDGRSPVNLRQVDTLVTPKSDNVRKTSGRTSIFDSDDEESDDMNDLFSVTIIKKTKKEMNSSRPIQPYVPVSRPKSKSIFDDDDSDQDDIFARKDDTPNITDSLTSVATEKNVKTDKKFSSQTVEKKNRLGNAPATAASVSVEPKSALFDDSDSDLDIFK